MSVVQRAGWEDGDVHKIKEREINVFYIQRGNCTEIFLTFPNSCMKNDRA